MLLKKISVILIIFTVIIFFAGCQKKASPPVSDDEASGTSGLIPQEKEFHPDPDSVSAASTTFYFTENTLTRDELFEAIHNLAGGALAISTVNADGAPNLAYTGPDMIEDDVMMFGLSDNQTRINIEEQKFAVAGVYIYDPEWEGGLSESRGARLVLRLIEDKEEIERLKSRVPDAPDNVLFMRIIKVLPVG